MKGDVIILMMFIFGVMAAIVGYVFISRGTTTALHTQCVTNIQKTADTIVAFISKIKNVPDKISIPITLGNCVDALIFSSQENIYGPLSKTGLATDQVFDCPKNYKSAIVAVPFIEKSNFVEAAIDAKQGKPAKLFNWVKEAVGVGLKPYCTALPDPNYVFKGPVEVVGSKAKEKKFCLKISAEGDGVFNVEQAEIETYQQCQGNIPELPLIV